PGGLRGGRGHDAVPGADHDHGSAHPGNGGQRPMISEMRPGDPRKAWRHPARGRAVRPRRSWLSPGRAAMTAATTIAYQAAGPDGAYPAWRAPGSRISTPRKGTVPPNSS